MTWTWPKGWAGDISGGLAGAVVSLAFALSFGLLAFAPLGTAHADVGVVAGFASAIYGQLIAGVIGRTVHPGSTPRAAACLVLSGLVAVLVADPALAPSATQGPERIVALAGASVLLSGVLQLLIAWLKLTQLARYVPFPFVAGFMCGIAVLIILSQIWPLAGVHQPASWRGTWEALEGIQPATLGIGLVTAIVIVVAEKAPKIPSLLVGLIFGSALYYAVATLTPGVTLGPVIGPIPATLPPPTMLSPLLAINGDVLLRALPAVMATAALLAVVGTLDTLAGTVAIDLATDGRHNPRREVVAHGLANIASGLCGGAPVVFSPVRALASWNAGGRTWLTLAIAVGALAIIVLAGNALIAAIPLVALAAVIIINSLGLIDRWVKGLVARLPKDAARGDPWRMLSIATVIVVAVVTVAFGFVPALIVGLVLSAMLTMIEMNRALVRRVVPGTLRPSRRTWGTDDLPPVQEARARARVIELEGSLFFGSAERLAEQVEPLAGSVDTIVLDCRHVTHIDPTGALMLERLTRRMDKQGTTVILAGVSVGGRLGNLLLMHNAFVSGADRHWAPDVDKAMERTERDAVYAAGRAATDEIPLGDFPLLDGLAKSDVVIVERYVTHDRVEPARVLFREGDPGDTLYLLTRGAVEISIAVEPDRRHRIVTMSAGALFGEAALLDGRPRSATAVAVEASAFYALTGTALDELVKSHPGIATTLLRNLARDVSRRMRETDQVLRALDDSQG
jgi:MFS superfamily sulfate permease-like transporter